MLISRNWLQFLFADPLPPAEELERALTFHAFEIDGVDLVRSDYILDVKVTPNRGHDCLCHRGIAKELSAILKLPLKDDPLAQATPDFSQAAATVSNFSAAGLLGDAAKSDPVAAAVVGSSDFAASPRGPAAEKAELPTTAGQALKVSIQNPLCKRYIAGHIKGVKVGPSPAWLKERLESIGQRSINNVVDATNYVMFTIGQPLHAFAAEKLTKVDGTYSIAVRAAKDGECLLALDDKSYTLDPSMLVIADHNTDATVGIAGVKGGKPAGVSELTTEIIIESANFDGVSTRKTAQALKLRTDASARYEQVISPDLAAYGMRMVTDLILEIACPEGTRRSGEGLQGFVDVYPEPQPKRYASVTVEKINKVLGIQLTGADVADVFQRLGFGYKEESGVFEVSVPFERLDIEIAEDLVEEVGRIIGYDKVPATELPPFTKPVEINKNFAIAEALREKYASEGYSEVFTSVFANKGEKVVLNKVDGTNPYLRNNLRDGVLKAAIKNAANKDFLNLKQIRLFEIGSVWEGGEEKIHVFALHETRKDNYTEDLEGGEKRLEDAAAAKGLLVGDVYGDFPLSQTERYQSFSKYPYIVRDVAAWFPADVDATKIETLIKNEAGELCIKISLFDKFEKAAKDGAPAKTSLAFRLIFQSFDRTLTDDDANSAMEKVYSKLKAEGFEIR